MLTFGFDGVKELRAKLDRDAAALQEEVTGDGFFNFVVTGYSMIDWIKNDPTVPTAAKTQAEIDGLHGDYWLKICGDLANASKHFTLSRRIPVTTAAVSRTGFGAGRFGKGGFGTGEESITIQVSGGTTFPALNLVTGVVSTWDKFFTRHGL